MKIIIIIRSRMSILCEWYYLCMCRGLYYVPYILHTYSCMPLRCFTTYFRNSIFDQYMPQHLLHIYIYCKIYTRIMLIQIRMMKRTKIRSTTHFYHFTTCTRGALHCLYSIMSINRTSISRCSSR